MRHVRAAFMGLAVAVVLTTVALGGEMVSARRSVIAQMANCESALNGGGGICSGTAQFGGREVPAVFALGFVAGYAWRIRARRPSNDPRSAGASE